ncbi:UNVERIFIED_CONTAM: Low-temperature-induced protein [Sesamum radiatum]|uniref:Low-temperature-induced protein n=1 Tax=Sesamum radiatum TaxID=300843 RepID=A0AAW2JY96_SESRA
MEAQLQRPSHGQDHHYEDLRTAGLHSVMEGEREGEHNQHGEKKSVLKKVKEKAKKIKDTMKKHGHGHDHASEEDDDESEEMVTDPDVHGAPMYESAVITGTKLPMQTDVNLEKPMDTREDRYSRPTVTSELYPTVVDEGESARSGPGILGMDSPFEAREPKNKNPLAVDVQEPKAVEPTVRIGPLFGFRGRPSFSKEWNWARWDSRLKLWSQSGKEADVAPLVQRLDNLNIGDKSESKPETKPESYTGSHDQISPKIADPTQLESMPRDSLAGKISSATSTIADKAVSAKNVVALKLGYGGQRQDAGEDLPQKPAADYGHKVAETLAPVYGKLAGAGTAVLSKVRRGGGGEHESGDEVMVKGTDKGVSMKEYLAEKLKPGEEDKVLSEVITEAFHKKQPTGWETEATVVENSAAAGGQTSNAGVVDRLKGAVGSWLGKSAGTQTAGLASSGGVGQREEEVMGEQQLKPQQSSGN